MIQAEANTAKLYAEMDQLMQTGASDEEMKSFSAKIDGRKQVYTQAIDAAYQEVMLVEMRADVLMVVEEAASLKSEIDQAKKTGMINGVKVSKEEIEIRKVLLITRNESSDSFDTVCIELLWHHQIYLHHKK